MTLLAPSSSRPASTSAEGLVVEELSVEFGGLRALDGVSMCAGRQEVVGVIGPNGAGKTTLFNVICGFVRPRSGEICYRGVALGRHRPHDLNRLGIARTLQGVGLCEGLSVLENVMLGSQAHLHSDLASALFGLRRSSREEQRVAAAARAQLDRLGIGHHAGRLPATLPYALQKRTALARALIAEPTLLLLDEPASGLSEEETGKLVELMRELAAQIGILVVEHRMDVVNAVCDHVVVLNFGRVIAEGSPAEIRTNPDVATAYLGRDVHDAGEDARDAHKAGERSPDARGAPGGMQGELAGEPPGGPGSR
ncbi:MAG TPA: ABC transporter ATP-binding protein [Acidimicrobiales bacterium]|nr:ABC transporter ATP-binding protein [Acidimicrobiales bacterium]